MGEENFNLFHGDDITGDNLYKQLSEGYDTCREVYCRATKKDDIKRQLAQIDETKAVFKRVLAEHRADGDMAAFVLGTVALKTLSVNMLASLVAVGPHKFIGMLGRGVVIPMVSAWQAELERETMDNAIAELEK